MARLGDICIQITDGSHNPPASVGESKYLMLSSKNIDDDCITLNDPRYLSKDHFDTENKRTNIEPDDLLMTIVGTIGRVAIVPNAFTKICVQRSVAVLKPKSDIVYNRFLMYHLQNMRPQLERESRGVAQKGIYLKQIGNLTISLPPLDKQRKIAAVLDKVSDLIAKRRQQLDKLDEMVKARFVELFGDMVFNPYGWPTRRLVEVADIVSGITKGRKTKEQNLIEVPYMAVSNVKDGYIDWTTVKTILAAQSEIEQYRLLPDDILMTEGGDPDKLGRGAIIQNPPENCIHQNHIFRVRLNETLLLPCYFAEFLKHQKAKQYFLRCAKQTTGIASINMSQLKGLPTLVPSLELQNHFAAFVEQTEKTKSTISRSLEKLETLKKALMQEYFE